ncbi:MAG: hypothetical protein LBV06_00405 [Propionibacteriaceae bacterium]|jgi:hypothetical protein|nr:hypothetical protein [Propionibacteriaceae bacterium]
MAKTRCGAVGLMMVAACLLAGCVAPSGDGHPGEADQSIGDGVSSTSDGVVSGIIGDLPLARAETPMDPPPPLAAYAAYMEGPAENPGYLARRAERLQQLGEATARCMADLGFRYIPWVSSDNTAQNRADSISQWSALPVPLLSSDRDVVAREGYGVLDVIQQHAGDGSDDPNKDYWATLSEAESDAYFTALWGDFRDPEGTRASSCGSKAQAQFPELTERGRVSEFLDEFSDLTWSAWLWVIIDDRSMAGWGGEGFALDPRRLQLDREWGGCMSDQGYPIDNSGINSGSGPSLAMYLAERTRPDGTVGPERENATVDEIPPEELNLLGTPPERAVALADFDCRVETNYMARVAEIRRSKDEEFIRTHQAELDRLVAAADTW